MTKRMTSIVLAAFVTLPSALSLWARQDDSIAYPQDYRKWAHVKSTLVGPQSVIFEQNGGLHHFYANEKALEGYRTGKFPDGSVLIDERLETRETAGVTTEGPRRSLAVMVKDSRRHTETDGWGFEVFIGASQTERALNAQGRLACYNCHAKRKDQDFVYSTFRK
jgi:Cytochrome P460